jgi:multidrug resistance protein, MATE family
MSLSENSAPSPASLRTLWQLAWPVVVSRSTQVVVGLADALMVAHLGQSALAATTAGAMNTFAFFIFPIGIAFILSSFSSQLTGRGDAAGARRFGWYGLILAALAQALVLLLLPWIGSFVGAFDYEPAVAGAMSSYISIRLLSTGAAVGIEALGNYYSGTGNTSLQMKFNLLAMVANVGFNWLLIDGNLGCPALGVAGAAWGSTFSTWIEFLGFLVVFLRKGRGLGRLGLRRAEFWRVLRFGTPSGFNWSFEFFAFLAFINIVVGGLGTMTLAAFMAVMQLNSFGFMPAFAFSSAGAVLTGQAIGAKNRDAVPGILWLTFRVNALWMGVLGLAYLFFPRLLLGPFVPGGGGESAFLEIGAKLLCLSAFWQIVDAAGITLGEVLRAAGDTAYAMWTRGVLAWCVFLPGSWLTVRGGGGELAATAWLLIYLGLLAVILFLRFRSGAWRRVELVGDEHLPPV